MTGPSDRENQADRFRLKGDPNVTYWEPSGVVTAMWVSLSIVLGALAFFLFGLIYVIAGQQPADGELAFDWRIIVPLTVGILVLHQLIHAAAARLCGGSPRFDLDVIQFVVPVMYCRVIGQVFTRAQFLSYALAPLVVPSLLGVGFMLIDERAVWMILPLAANASLSIRDVWMAWVVWQMPAGSLIQADRDGLRLIRAE